MSLQFMDCVLNDDIPTESATPENGTNYFRYHDACFNLGYSPFEYQITKVTLKGIRVATSYEIKDHLIIHNHKKKYAHTTRKEALNSYVHRKLKQISILETQLEIAKQCYKAAEIYYSVQYPE